MANSADARKLVKALKKQCWSVEIARNGHYKATNPEGQWVQFSRSPSDHRSLMNTVSRLRKMGFVRQPGVAF